MHESLQFFACSGTKLQFFVVRLWKHHILKVKTAKRLSEKDWPIVENDSKLLQSPKIDQLKWTKANITSRINWQYQGITERIKTNDGRQGQLN